DEIRRAFASDLLDEVDDRLLRRPVVPGWQGVLGLCTRQVRQRHNDCAGNRHATIHETNSLRRRGTTDHGGRSVRQLDGSAPIFSPRSTRLFMLSLMNTPGTGGVQPSGMATMRT